MRKFAVVAAALALLSACATAEPEPEIVAETPAPETSAEQIERLAMEGLALQREGSLPAGLQVSILELEEVGGAFVYKVELLTGERRRSDRNYVLYGQCPRTDMVRCADQIVAAARMLKD